ncbi:MAG TPA: hypothetical protein VK509_18745 [Polyangiales bacterium]|nr:hypothetical protein [Polyangiales bacterium]
MARPNRRPLYALLAAAAAAAAAGGCVLGGQTGSEYASMSAPAIGPVGRPGPCAVDADCKQRIDAKLAVLRAPRTAPRRVVAAECVATPGCSNLPVNTCSCAIAVEGAAQADVYLLGGSTCALHGRGLDCLWPPGELQACTPGTCDCAQMCAHARDLLAADDARAIIAEANVARCGASCQYVVQLQDRCYAGDSLTLDAQEVPCAQDELGVKASSAVAGSAGSGSQSVICPAHRSVALAAVTSASLDACMPASGEGKP